MPKRRGKRKWKNSTGDDAFLKSKGITKAAYYR